MIESLFFRVGGDRKLPRLHCIVACRHHTAAQEIQMNGPATNWRVKYNYVVAVVEHQARTNEADLKET